MVIQKIHNWLANKKKKEWLGQRASLMLNAEYRVVSFMKMSLDKLIEYQNKDGEPSSKEISNLKLIGSHSSHSFKGKVHPDKYGILQESHSADPDMCIYVSQFTSVLYSTGWEFKVVMTVASSV